MKQSALQPAGSPAAFTSLTEIVAGRDASVLPSIGRPPARMEAKTAFSLLPEKLADIRLAVTGA